MQFEVDTKFQHSSRNGLANGDGRIWRTVYQSNQRLERDTRPQEKITAEEKLTDRHKLDRDKSQSQN